MEILMDVDSESLTGSPMGLSWVMSTEPKIWTGFGMVQKMVFQ